MRLEDLDYGHYYTIRGAGSLLLVAWHNGEKWWFEDVSNFASYEVRDDRLIECDMFLNERGPSRWTLDDVITTAQAAREAGKILPTHISVIDIENLFWEHGFDFIDDVPPVDMDVWGDTLEGLQ